MNSSSSEGLVAAETDRKECGKIHRNKTPNPE